MTTTGDTNSITAGRGLPEFWFSPTSPYSYLSIMRIVELSKQAGVEWKWQPVGLPPIFKALGWKVNPYADFQVKQDYMWLDVARLAKLYGLPFVRPKHYPQNPLPAIKVALVACDQGWGVDFAIAATHTNFGEGHDLSEASNIEKVVAGMGKTLDVGQIISDPAMDRRMEAIAKEALKRKLFGAPTFFVGREMFWGNDRLEHAIAYAASKKVLSS